MGESSSAMREVKFEAFAKAVCGLALRPWQIRYLRAIDEYHAVAQSSGLTKSDATERLSMLMEKSKGSLSYSSEAAIRDARLSVLRGYDKSRKAT